MKIIFLDIDGVLNNDLWFQNWQDYISLCKEKIDHAERQWFDPRCVAVLNDITDSTGAKIVVSSSWRIGRTVEGLKTLLEEIGVTGEVISKTPSLSFSGLKDYDYSVPRGNEIKAWLETNKEILSVKISKVKYVILDDDSDMLYWQRINFIHIDPYCGLTPLVGRKAKNLLNNVL